MSMSVEYEMCIRVNFNVQVNVGNVLRKNIFFFQAEDGIRDLVRSRGLGDVYKRQCIHRIDRADNTGKFASKFHNFFRGDDTGDVAAAAVSYTHLTLPTNYSV